MESVLKRKTAITLMMLIATLMLLAVSASTIVKAEETAQVAKIWTDKIDYAPEETVTVFGIGFMPESTVTVEVTRPDYHVDSWDIVSDSEGAFTTTYLLDGITGTYIITATDGTNTATATFTDAVNIQSVTPSGATYPPAKTTFLTTESVYALITATGSGDNTVDIYVLSSLPALGGTLTNVAGDTVDTYTPNTAGNNGPYLIWSTPTVGNYYIFVDDNQNGHRGGAEVYASFSVTAPGTTLSASVTATPSWTRTFAWTIDKSVTPDTWNLFKGDSGTSRYTITVTKDFGTDAAYIEGDVSVTNTGLVATQNLAITVKVKYGGNVVGTDTLTVSGQLGAGASNTYSYHIDIDPADLHAGGSYDVIAYVTITNYQGYMGSPYGPEPSTTVTLNPNLVNDAINVDDTNGGSWAFSESGSVSYTKTFTSAGTYLNTATIRETGQSDGATVTVNVYELEVTKDAVPLITRTYRWTIDKWADEAVVVLGKRESQSVDYHVQVGATYTDAYSVSGTISVYNPAPIPAVINGIYDIVSPDIEATVDFGSITFPYTLAAGATLEVTYSASLPDGTARTNTATVTIQNYDYDYQMNPTKSDTTDFSGSADVDFTEATIDEVDESITLSDTNTEFGGPKTVTFGDLTDGSKTFDYTKTIGPYDLPGIYAVENTASFETCDLGVKGSDSWTITVYRIGSAVTTSSFYLFDYDAADGRQFKLILTPDVPTYPNLYRVTATNPGQFYYNIFYYAEEQDSPFTITIPDPFVTQGANPVHIYDSISTSGDYLLPAGNDITSQFIIEWSNDGRTCTITPIESYSGPIYITIHLDYGFKKTLGGLGKDNSNNALDGANGPIKIKDLTDYEFSVSGPLTDSDTIQNRNVFKRDPGFVGLVTDSEGNPVAGVKVQIYGPDGKLLATVYTDKDGWYFYNYKYTGKAATFILKLPDYNLMATVTIKSNSITKTDFVIP